MRCLADGACRTIDDLNDMLDLTRRQISDGAARLVLRDYAERVEIGCYQLTVAGLEAARQGEVITSGPWRPDTVKVRKPVKVYVSAPPLERDARRRNLHGSDLVMAAARDDDADPYNNAPGISATLSRSVMSRSWSTASAAPADLQRL